MKLDRAEHLQYSLLTQTFNKEADVCMLKEKSLLFKNTKFY